MAAAAATVEAVGVAGGRRRRSGSMALGDLLRREASAERASASASAGAGGRERERWPSVAAGQACRAKKGEDFALLKPACERLPAGGAPFSAFALFDGHNGSGAAVYAKENLLSNVMCCVPADLSGDEWLAALPRALVAGFVKTDKDFQTRAHSSGTTVTFVIIDGYVVTVASVGDSRCVLEAEGTIYHLSADHRFDASEEEVGRVTECGGEVGRLNVVGGAEIGPLRCWPGGLCLSRSIGDQDVGEFIIPVPYVKQIKLSSAGGRIIISSDGVWDALTADMAFSCARGLPPEAAADQIVKEAIASKGLRDDTTCIVIDIIPPEKISPTVQPAKKAGKGLFKNIFYKKATSDSPCHADKDQCTQPDLVEEVFEDGCPSLSRRLDSEYPVRNMFKLFICAICQVELESGQGISIHEGLSKSGKLRPWDGPFLCHSCQEKKEAMEGKRHSRDSSSRNSGSSE
ncbi:LOW QUALITY PROTEIN: probable protein phosphatase 2C 40 [Oryza glaberrima]|uniref:protein-serine/threonine phosphatase n=1 Tax=Oryza glaberrima TaxID=4538 RepID=I1PLQ4_ORYGL|nr:LOW QUALITY PROTEIN: probable protein phosphatase 2C 40 [Oryza glaberrima]